MTINSSRTSQERTWIIEEVSKLRGRPVATVELALVALEELAESDLLVDALNPKTAFERENATNAANLVRQILRRKTASRMADREDRAVHDLYAVFSLLRACGKQ
jgi:hypothetical protein